MEKIKLFRDKKDLRKWFIKHHKTEQELWIGFYKKASGKGGVTPGEAVDEALCFGWIDGIRKSIDEISYCNRYTPRTRKSKWSKINTENVRRLIESGEMQEAGLKAVADAKADGRWAMAYDSSKTATLPDEFMKALKKNKKAQENFSSLSKQALYSIIFKLQNLKKQETREKWIKIFIDKIAEGVL